MVRLAFCIGGGTAVRDGVRLSWQFGVWLPVYARRGHREPG
jgi:hypothetical protein